VIQICQLTSLEILDLGRNKLKVLPPELVKLTSLKVLSVEKNRIEELPLFLADMASLQILKLAGNPLRFPPPEVFDPQASSPPNNGYQDSVEMDHVVVTSQVKRYLRQKAVQDRSETESGEEEFSEGTETPRPIKRVMSGRFPIRVNGSDMSDLRSPALPRPPPIPSRSHYRGLSQQNAALRRPNVAPLAINGLSANERLRSNSENILQASRNSTAADRSRRMGIVSKKSELSTVDESRSNRHSHYRGLSHGSAMSGNSNGSVRNARSPASPADSISSRSNYVRRLSSLPERKRISTSPDRIIEGSKGILYALFQIHPHIEGLIGLTRDGTDKRTSLEAVFYNANTHVEDLDRHLQDYDSYTDEDEDATPRSNEAVHRACLTAVNAYTHVCTLLRNSVATIVENADPRYIRTLMLLLYGGIAEINNAGHALFSGQMGQVIHENDGFISESSEGTLRSLPRDKSMTPTRARPGMSRSRGATVIQYPSHLRVATDTTLQPSLNSSRMLTSATPRSGDSFISASGGRMTGGEVTDDDIIFEKIFLNLQQTSDLSVRSLPTVISHFNTAMEICSQQVTPEQPKIFWEILIQTAANALQITEALRFRLSNIKLKEPGIRTQGAFWELCNTFVDVSIPFCRLDSNTDLLCRTT